MNRSEQKLMVIFFFALAICLGAITVPAEAGETCEVPDNGSGTATLPPIGCDYTSPDGVFKIINDLPSGTTIEMEGILMDFICCAPCDANCSMPLALGQCETAGGSLGGHGHCFEATLDLTVTGTGSLQNFNRHLAIPVFCEVHTAPRNQGDPVQDFDTVLYRFRGELFGDPDFCTFRIKGGTDFGLPSPGHTTLTDIGGGLYHIDSFFDITYQIEFQGCPGSPLQGFAGTTTDTILMETGFTDCEPTPNGSSCRTGTCPGPGHECEPNSVDFDPGTGEVTVVGCECHSAGDCHVDWSQAQPYGCVGPDDGNGTTVIPPQDCEYASLYEVYQIIAGLPPGTTIELDGPLYDFINIVRTTGGTLGGEKITFDATLDWAVKGTGGLAGFNRHLAVPVSGEVHTGPRNAGDPCQVIVTDMYLLQGELFGDPDFCTLRFKAGTGLGMPGPGQTTLIELGSGDYVVTSFFDITYQIEFEGCPASPLEDYNGITTATIRIETGTEPVLPACYGNCPGLMPCIETVTYNPDGTINISCECEPSVCEPMPDGSACRPSPCEDPLNQCLPKCVNYDPNTREVTVLDCDCRGLEDCFVGMPRGPAFNCVVPDNGTGTATLPPDGCQYISPNDVFIITNGLPAETTIEMDGILMDFYCCGPCDGKCSLALVQDQCETAGGTLGGHGHCFEATLDLTVRGTGSLQGFNRHLAVPVFGEVHTGPRNPGDPVQDFDTDFYRLKGELFGDPHFCTFRITGGTDFGLPSPGHTTLYELPSGDFAVDSFFDITYQIEFEGCPASVIEDYNGTTTATIRMETGSRKQPTCSGPCTCGWCRETVTTNPDGTIDICCDCLPDADLNRDGIVDLKDLAILCSQWLTTRP
ncbi:MAG: hypothetical protein ACYTDW_02755 [Planctomycetota bacterium]|jgi:hypothetical protein